jgi:hypothetical protein
MLVLLKIALFIFLVWLTYWVLKNVANSIGNSGVGWFGFILLSVLFTPVAGILAVMLTERQK